jgi:hypothetical protein
MRKTEVYSWRVTPALKASLEEAAQRQKASVAHLLDKAVEGYLAETARGGDEEQRRLHERAARCAGSIAGGDPRRATEARRLLRARLRRSRRAG